MPGPSPRRYQRAAPSKRWPPCLPIATATMGFACALVVLPLLSPFGRDIGRVDVRPRRPHRLTEHMLASAAETALKRLPASRVKDPAYRRSAGHAMAGTAWAAVPAI